MIVRHIADIGDPFATDVTAMFPWNLIRMEFQY